MYACLPFHYTTLHTDSPNDIVSHTTSQVFEGLKTREFEFIFTNFRCLDIIDTICTTCTVDGLRFMCAYNVLKGINKKNCDTFMYFYYIQYKGETLLLFQ